MNDWKNGWILDNVNMIEWMDGWTDGWMDNWMVFR